jgi:hypothetical protein
MPEGPFGFRRLTGIGPFVTSNPSNGGGNGGGSGPSRPVDRFIVHYTFGHTVWNSIRNSARMGWKADQDTLIFAVSSASRQESWERNPGPEYDDENEWVERGAIPLARNLDFSSALDTLPARETNLSGSSTTALGTRFWFEFRQDSEITNQGKETLPAEANPIRFPAADGDREMIEEWADSFGGEIFRVKGAVFDEQFADAGFDAGSPVGEFHNDYHVRITDIQSTGELEDVWNGAQDLMERVVRKHS